MRAQVLATSCVLSKT